MTRTEKWKGYRAFIEALNLEYLLKDYKGWLYIVQHQNEIKKEGGYKH